jgi:hypothetical protein
MTEQVAPSEHEGSADPDGERSDTLPLDEVFEILKNSRRRETLHYLRENDGTATLSEVAEHIAALENDITVEQLNSSQRKRVYVGLYQCHLPKMDDRDVVEFDKNRGTIVLGPNADQVWSYLGTEESTEWYKLYLVLTVAGAVLFSVSVAGATQYGLSPSVVLLVLLAGMFLGSVAHATGLDLFPSDQ